MSTCQRTIDSLTVAWCQTSVFDPPKNSANFTNCGSAFSTSRNYWWDSCVENITASTSYYLTDFESMWTTITVSSTGTVATAYLIAGILASFMTATRFLLWLPLVSAIIGGVLGFIIGSTFAVAISFLYLSIPYAIDFATAILLGVSLGLFLVYSSFGRQFGRYDTLHASEYVEFEGSKGG